MSANFFCCSSFFLSYPCCWCARLFSLLAAVALLARAPLFSCMSCSCATILGSPRVVFALHCFVPFLGSFLFFTMRFLVSFALNVHQIQCSPLFLSLLFQKQISARVFAANALSRLSCQFSGSLTFFCCCFTCIQ